MALYRHVLPFSQIRYYYSDASLAMDFAEGQPPYDYVLGHSFSELIEELFYLMPYLKLNVEETIVVQIFEYAGCHGLTSTTHKLLTLPWPSYG